MKHFLVYSQNFVMFPHSTAQDMYSILNSYWANSIKNWQEIFEIFKALSTEST